MYKGNESVRKQKKINRMEREWRNVDMLSGESALVHKRCKSSWERQKMEEKSKKRPRNEKKRESPTRRTKTSVKF